MKILLSREDSPAALVGIHCLYSAVASYNSNASVLGAEGTHHRATLQFGEYLIDQLGQLIPNRQPMRRGNGLNQLDLADPTGSIRVRARQRSEYRVGGCHDRRRTRQGSNKENRIEGHRVRR